MPNQDPNDATHAGSRQSETPEQRATDRISKVQRWLDLIAYLVGRRVPASVEELMERLPAYAGEWEAEDATARESVRRKFERDKDELRALGIPLETVSYRMGALGEEMEGYQIRKKDFYLPYLRLLEEEKSSKDGGGDPGTAPGPTHSDTIELARDDAACAVDGLRSLARLPAFPLSDAARSALRKITFDLEPDAFGEAPVLFAVPDETARARATVERLSDALARRKRVGFTYRGIQRGEDTERSVHPYGLLFQHSHWYMVAWDEDRDAERLFRVDRVSSLEVNSSRPNTPDYEIPPGPILERYRNREAWELGEPDDGVEARVRFRFPTSLWAERNQFGVKVGQEDEDGSAVRVFEVRQPNAFLRWVLSLAGEAEIESPDTLKSEFLEMAAAVAALYRGKGA